MKTLKVIKIGSNIINDTTYLIEFLKKFAALDEPKILIHGGGILANKLAYKLGVNVKMINGRRITDSDTLDIITMVYAGKINKFIVAQLQANDCNSIGFSGADGNSILSEKRVKKTIDFGFVGDITKIHTKTLTLLLEHEITPVFCSISHDSNGQLLNTNADTIASALAIAFTKDYIVELYYCFEKNGVLEDYDNENSVIENIDQRIYKNLIDDNIITEGMLPKLHNCINAINQGVAKVCIGKPEMLFNKNAIYTSITL